jgi:hypothetical protein
MKLGRVQFHEPETSEIPSEEKFREVSAANMKSKSGVSTRADSS